MEQLDLKIQQESEERYKDTERPLQILPMVDYLKDRGIHTQQEFKEQVDAGMVGEMLKTLPTGFDLNLGIDILAVSTQDRELLHTKWQDMKPEDRARLERYELVKGRNAELLVAEYQFVRERIMRYMYFAGQRTELMSDVEVKPQGWWPELKHNVSEGWGSMSSNEKTVAIGALILTTVFALIAEPADKDGKQSWMYRLGQLIKGGAVIFGVGHLGSKLFTGKGLMDNIAQLTSGTEVTEPGYWEKTLNTTKQNADRFNTFLVEAATEDISFKRVYDAYLKAKQDPKHELDMDELGLTMDGRETYTALEAAFAKFSEPLDAMHKDPKNHEKEFATVWALIMTNDPKVQADVVESFEANAIGKGAAAAGAAVSGGFDKAKKSAGGAIDTAGQKAGEGWQWLVGEWNDIGRNLDFDKDGARTRFYNSVNSDAELETFINGNAHIEDVFLDKVTESLKPVIIAAKDPKLVFVMSEVSVDTQSPPEEQIAAAANEAYKNGLRALEAGEYNLHIAEPLGGVYLAHKKKYRLYLKSYLPGSQYYQQQVVGG